MACQPHLLEASVFGYDDVYRKLQPFVAKWREIRRQQPGARVGGGEGRKGARMVGWEEMADYCRCSCGRAWRLLPDLQSMSLLCPSVNMPRLSTPINTSRPPPRPAPPLIRAPPALYPPHLQLYMVSVDISRAFDSIDIARLLHIVEPAIRSPAYTMIT